MLVLAITVVTVLIAVNALYVGAEFAAVSARRSRIRQLKDEGSALAAWLLPYIETPAALDRYIAACQIGITLSSLVLGAYAQATFGVWLAPSFERFGGLGPLAAQSTSTVVVLLVLTVGQVLFGELIPKSLALQYPTQAALYTLVPMVASLWLYRPFITFLNGTGLRLLRLLGAPHEAARHIHSPEEIELLIAESRDGGLLEPDEHLRLHRALRLTLRQAKQLMVARPRIAALNIETPLDQVIPLATGSPFSRLPVFRGSIDNIVGVIQTKDVVRWYINEQGSTSLAPLVRPVATVHESVTADKILKQLRERRVLMAVVVDEFGGTSGIVTLEDVLAELLGDVGDELKPNEPTAERIDDDHYRLPGLLTAEDAAALLGTQWDSDATTVGGLIVESLGHIPEAGEHVAMGDYEFTVERTSGHAVDSVLARRIVAEREAE